MEAFSYSNSPYPIRSDLPDAFRHAWRKISEPGTWWTGAARVAIAQESRQALDCGFCRARKAALSPNAPIEGWHTTCTRLDDKIVDVVHRLVTDPARLSEQWLAEIIDEHFTYGHYVETVSVVVTVMSIDYFNKALGFDLEPLPEPSPGQPSRYEPSNLETKTAWVPMIAKLAEAEEDLWPGSQITNVIRALSLVPDAVRLLKSLSAAQYLPMSVIPDPVSSGDRALDRAQIEFVAAKVSAYNDCFY